MNDIEALLKATIQTKVIEAFNSTPEMVEKLVAAALSKEVNEHGQKPGGYGDKKMPYMEWLVGDEIRKAVCKCVHEYVQSHEEEIKERVQAAMVSSDFMKPVAEVMADVLSKSYNWTIDLKIAQDQR
jgi:hypothetical protein